MDWLVWGQIRVEREGRCSSDYLGYRESAIEKYRRRMSHFPVTYRLYLQTREVRDHSESIFLIPP